MNYTKTGGPAFPVAIENQVLDDGMSLRDYFAIGALPGLMGRNWSHHKGTDEELIVIWATSSYEIADAMLKARTA